MTEERYKCIYKCQLCGETFKSGEVGKTDSNKMMNLLFGMRQGFTTQLPSYMCETHETDSHIGYAELVGFEKGE